MRNLVTILIALAALLFGTYGPVFSQSVSEMDSRLDFLYGEHARYKAFFTDLKTAIAGGDKAAVAAMVRYPFQTNIGGKRVTIPDAGGFIARYEDMVTNRVREAVARQPYETLFANWQGVMIGHSEIWFSGFCKDNSCEDPQVLISAINTSSAELPPVDPATVRHCFDATLYGETLPGCIGQAAKDCAMNRTKPFDSVDTHCRQSEAGAWDDILNDVYQEAIVFSRRMDLEKPSVPSEEDLLRQAQRAWIRYRDGECAYIEARETGHDGRQWQVADCLLTMTASRALMLRDIMPGIDNRRRWFSHAVPTLSSGTGIRASSSARIVWTTRMRGLDCNSRWVTSQIGTENGAILGSKLVFRVQLRNLTCQPCLSCSF